MGYTCRLPPNHSLLSTDRQLVIYGLNNYEEETFIHIHILPHNFKTAFYKKD